MGYRPPWGIVFFPVSLEIACLTVAGAADLVSGDRGTNCNETIPHLLRGRLAGIEMIGYPTGPVVDNARQLHCRCLGHVGGGRTVVSRDSRWMGSPPVALMVPEHQVRAARSQRACEWR